MRQGLLGAFEGALGQSVDVVTTRVRGELVEELSRESEETQVGNTVRRGPVLKDTRLRKRDAGMLAPYYRFEVDRKRRIFSEWQGGGSWSKADATRYVREFKKAVAPLLGRPWGKHSHLDGYAEAEAAAVIIDFLRWSLANGMVCVAYVLGDATSRLQAKRIISTSGVSVVSDYFLSDAEAIAWLTEHSPLAELKAE